MQTLIQTASATYIQDADGDIFERRHSTSRCKPTEKRFFSKLNQTITQDDIERERAVSYTHLTLPTKRIV